jgi:hypothetical protein
MSDTRQFLDEMMPRIHKAETALHNGDAGPRFAATPVRASRCGRTPIRSPSSALL